MHRCFIKEEIHEINSITDKEDKHHLKNVLRIKKDEWIEIVDKKKEEYICKIINRDTLEFEIIKKSEKNRESNITIDLFQGLAKGSKMDSIIQKSVELGVSSITPTYTDRVIVKLNKKDEKKKKERYQKIAYEASKQSKRTKIAEINDFIKLKDIENYKEDYDIILLAYENEEHGIKEILNPSMKKIAIIIGPEGGFDPKEVDYLENMGVKSISLGNRILRTETASSMLISILQYELGDVN